MSTPRIPQDWYPDNERIVELVANQWEGYVERAAVALHIAQGGYTGSIDYMRDHGTSSHFINSRAGKIAQMVSVAHSAWANGLSWDTINRRWVCPHGHVVTPTWRKLRQGVNPNRTTISVEHEGWSGPKPPAVQLDATVRLLVWLGRRFPELTPYVPGETLIRHADIDPTDKSFCPGPGFDLDDIARRANALLQPAVETWVRAWTLRGVALPDEQRGWAIPQLYRSNYANLGACVRAEQYLLDGVSVALFERGLIYYLKETNRAYIGAQFPAGADL